MNQESRVNIVTFKQGLFITIGYSKQLVVNIPSSVQLLILAHIGSTIICKWQIYLFYIMIKNQHYDDAKKHLSNIRENILLYGCDEEDNIIIDSTNIEHQHSLFTPRKIRNVPLIRPIEDTIRGQLWRLLMGLNNINSNNYQNEINKGKSNEYYIKIRGDVKRTFLTSQQYNSRVSQSRLVRVLNSYVHQYEKSYCQGHDTIAGVLLYIMAELPAYEAFCWLNNRHFPTYFHVEKSSGKHPLIGSYAASYLAWDILKICDEELFNHLQPLPPHTYFFPMTSSIQTLSQPFTEVPKLWDFLFCFGFHLNPVMAAAHIIVNKKDVLSKSPGLLLQGLLSQRKWMNGKINARNIINCTMKLIMILKQSQHGTLWNNILLHCSSMDVAVSIRAQHKKGQVKKDVNDTTKYQSGAHEKDVNVISTKDLIEKDVLHEIITENEEALKDDTVGNTNKDDKQQHNDANNSNSAESSDDIEEESKSDNDNDADSSDDDSSAWSDDDDDDDDDDDGDNDKDDGVGDKTNSLSNYNYHDRFTELNEFELKDLEIETFDIYEKKHNESLSKYYVKFFKSQNRFIAMDCIDDKIMEHWNSYISENAVSAKSQQ